MGEVGEIRVKKWEDFKNQREKAKYNSAKWQPWVEETFGEVIILVNNRHCPFVPIDQYYHPICKC